MISCCSLLTQLNDLEEMKDELDPSEYEQSRAETLEQVSEFESSLKKMAEGNMTLVSDIGQMQLAIQNAVRAAFKSPEVIQMFERKENKELRSRLLSLDESFRLGRTNESLYRLQRRELLELLDKLGDTLSDAERGFLTQVSNYISHCCLNNAIFISHRNLF